MAASASCWKTATAFFAKRVVMATGLRGHEYRPAQFDGLPRALVSHSCEHTSYSKRYRGQRVAVIGRGQSACESAAFLHEAGAEVEMICRGNLTWNADPGQRGPLRKAVRALLGSMLIPPSQVGPFPFNWLNEAPGLIHRLSETARDRVNTRSLGATAILSMRPRLKDVPVDQGRTIFAARKVGDGVSLTLDNATKRFDHVVLATGYRIDVDQMTMLEPRLREKIARHGDLPVLNGGFESSVPGLHFVGAAAVASFGPLLRFIAGTGFAARRITRAALRGARALRRQPSRHLCRTGANVPRHGAQAAMSSRVDPQPMPGALIIGGAHVSIAVARSLGRRGIPVWLLANHPIATYSRYVQRSFPWPGADHPDGISSILDLAKQHGLHGWVLIATGDQDMHLIAKNHALLCEAPFASRRRIGTPSSGPTTSASPTAARPRSGSISRRALICTAWTTSSGSIAAFRSSSSRPSARARTSSRTPKPGRRTTATSCCRFTSAPPRSSATTRSSCRNGSPAPAKRNFPTPRLCDRGEPIVSLVARRRRQHPIDFGRSSTYVESIERKSRSKSWLAAS